VIAVFIYSIKNIKKPNTILINTEMKSSTCITIANKYPSILNVCFS